MRVQTSLIRGPRTGYKKRKKSAESDLSQEIQSPNKSID